MTHVVAAFKQNNFRGRGDTVGLNNSTFDHALDTDWTQDTSAVFRVRFLVQEKRVRRVTLQKELAFPIERLTPAIDGLLSDGLIIAERGVLRLNINQR